MADSTSGDNQLWKLANAMQGLAETVNSENPHIRIRPFLEACRLFDLKKFGCGADFHFVDMDITEQLESIENNSGVDETLQSVIERDIARDTLRLNSSLSRRIYRLKRVIELARIMLQEFAAHPEIESLAEPFSVAYGQVFAPVHGPLIREVYFVIKVLVPTVPVFMNALAVDEETVKEPMYKFINAAKDVLQHIESVFQSDESTAELTGLV